MEFHAWNFISFVLFLSLLLPVAVEGFSYTITGGTSSFSSIATYGTPALLNGNTEATINIPFNFTLDPANVYTTRYSSSIQPVSALLVTFNGDIFLGTSGTVSGPHGLCCGTCADAPRVAVINCNGINSSDVFYLVKSSSIIISYENVKFSPTSSDSLNAQAEIFSNGNVELRYGGNASLYGNVCDIGIADAKVNSCFGIPYGTCNSSGVCTSFPYNNEYLFGTYVHF